MTRDATGGTDREVAIELVPNCSLTPRQAAAFFASLCIVSFTIAGFFVAKGMWPVLPFAGLEMALLGWALRASLKRRGYTQTIIVTGSDIEIVTRDGRGEHSVAFPRHWARVRLSTTQGWRPGRLVIESHGRACEIGALLTDEERSALYGRLRRLVGAVDESPPLGGDLAARGT